MPPALTRVLETALYSDDLERAKRFDCGLWDSRCSTREAGWCGSTRAKEPSCCSFIAAPPAAGQTHLQAGSLPMMATVRFTSPLRSGGTILRRGRRRSQSMASRSRAECAGAGGERAFTFATQMVIRWNWRHRAFGQPIDRFCRSLRHAAVRHRLHWPPHCQVLRS